jgi:uncharacterized protein (DUF1697 family)
MPTHIALLRGVNVGGNPLKMERLRELCAELGFENVRTYVQSGNVVFESPRTPGQCLQRLKEKLAGETRLPVAVVLRTASDLRRIIDENPFLKKRGIDSSKLHVTLVDRAPAKSAAQLLSMVDAGDDEFRIAGAEIYIHCPNGYGQTKLSNTRIEKLLSVSATTRNWNTVNKLCEIATS